MKYLYEFISVIAIFAVFAVFGSGLPLALISAPLLGTKLMGAGLFIVLCFIGGKAYVYLFNNKE